MSNSVASQKKTVLKNENKRETSDELQRQWYSCVYQSTGE